jgi:predicted metal-binding membrane protein
VALAFLVTMWPVLALASVVASVAALFRPSASSPRRRRITAAATGLGTLLLLGPGLLVVGLVVGDIL